MNSFKWLFVILLSLIICSLIVLILLWASGSFNFLENQKFNFMNDGLFLGLLMVVSMAISYFYLYKR